MTFYVVSTEGFGIFSIEYLVLIVIPSVNFLISMWTRLDSEKDLFHKFGVTRYSTFCLVNSGSSWQEMKRKGKRRHQLF